MNQNPITLERFELVAGQLWLNIDYEQRIATLNFDIRQSRNAISLQLAQALSELSRQVKDSGNTRTFGKMIHERQILLLVLSSHCPDVFLSGGDLRELAGVSESQGHEFIRHMREFTDLLRSGPLVSVAILNGLAAGGGAEIALAADLRVSISKSARIYFAQSLWGVPAGWGMMNDLTNKGVFSSERRCGIAVAAQESLELQTLERLGLVDAKFEDSADAEKECRQWLSSLTTRLGRCPAELRHALIEQRPIQPADKLDDFDKDLFDRHWLAPEHRSRLNSFLAQRGNESKKR